MSGTDLQVITGKLEAAQSIADKCNVADIVYARGKANASDAIRLADAIDRVKQHLTKPVLAKLKTLANSSMGYEVDQLGSLTDGVLQDCICTAMLCGFNVLGWEWGVNNGKFFPKSNGLRRKILETPGVSSLTVTPGHPEFSQTSGYAKVPVTVAYAYKGEVIQRIFDGEQRIMVRSNQGVKVGADAAIGKAERKALKRVYEELAGFTLGYDEDDVIEGEVVTDDASGAGTGDNEAVRAAIAEAGMDEAGVQPPPGQRELQLKGDLDG